MKMILPILTSLFLISSSCKKNSDLLDAVVVWHGAQETDGCGWLLRVDTTEYYPVNLSEKMRQDGKKVRVAFDKLDNFISCGIPSLNAPKKWQIKILQIKSR